MQSVEFTYYFSLQGPRCRNCLNFNMRFGAVQPLELKWRPCLDLDRPCRQQGLLSPCVAHTDDTRSRNVNKKLVREICASSFTSDFDENSRKFLYKVVWNRAAFYSVHKNLYTRKKCAQESMLCQTCKFLSLCKSTCTRRTTSFLVKFLERVSAVLRSRLQ